MIHHFIDRSGPRQDTLAAMIQMSLAAVHSHNLSVTVQCLSAAALSHFTFLCKVTSISAGCIFTLAFYFLCFAKSLLEFSLPFERLDASEKLKLSQVEPAGRQAGRRVPSG